MKSNTYKEPKIIAEIGCNHKGDIQIAREMIQIAASFCKVDVVKFQKRNSRELLSESEYNAPHPNPSHSYGKTYGEHREFLEFSLDQHRYLKDFCEESGVVYSTSVWDMTSAREIVKLNPELIKIPSACNLNFPMLMFLTENYPGQLHISLGMTSKEEEASLIQLISDQGRLGDTVIYSCTSGYPVPFDDLCLLEIERLHKLYSGSALAIGFSGHHLGIAADIAGHALGATWIERHYTLDRTWKGTDHAASLEPDGLRRLVRDLKNVNKALRYKESDVLKIEEAQRTKLKATSVRVSR